MSARVGGARPMPVKFALLQFALLQFALLQFTLLHVSLMARIASATNQNCAVMAQASRCIFIKDLKTVDNSKLTAKVQPRK
jgi:hypothetical protein